MPTPKPSSPLSTTPVDEAGAGRGWVFIAILLWALLPLLRMQVSRIVFFDLLVLVLGAWIALDVMLRPRNRAPTRWITGGTRLYGWYALVLFAGLISGMNALYLGPWAFELLILTFIGAMMVVLDWVASRHIERFLRIGAWVFAVLALICGLAALLRILGVYTVTMFYEPVPGGLVSDKFSGPARTSSQWGIFANCFLLLPLVEAVQTRSAISRYVLIAAVVFGATSILASGSRMALAVMLLEVGGFILAYITLDKGSRASRRVLYVAILAIVFVVAYITIFPLLDDFWVVDRALGVFDFFTGTATVENDWRGRNWSWALQKVEEHPFIGVGLGTFRLYFDRHEIHSTYLSLWAEAGPLALLAYLAFVGAVAVHLLKALSLSRRYVPESALMICALGIGVGGCLVMNVAHLLTRSRYVVMLYILAFVYSEVVIRRARARMRASGVEQTR